MRISIEKLKNEILPEKYYKDYVLDLVCGFKELDSVLLIKMLLHHITHEDTSNTHQYETLHFDILELASNLLIYTMNNQEIVNYTIYAVKQVLPHLKAEFPGVESPHQVLRSTETYFKELINKKLDPFAYKHFLSQIVKDAYTNSNASSDVNVFWITYAVNLTAYASIYAFSKFKESTRKLAEVCAMNAVYMAIRYSSVNFNRIDSLTKIINYGLRLIKMKHSKNRKIIFLYKEHIPNYSLS